MKQGGYSDNIYVWGRMAVVFCRVASPRRKERASVLFNLVACVCHPRRTAYRNRGRYKMVIHEVRILYVYGDEFTIKPLADAHLGNKYCDVKAIKEYLSETNENTRIIGTGDGVDAIITRDLKRYMKHSDATETDAIIDEQTDGIYQMLFPYKEKIIGLMDGNHEHSILKYHGTSITKRLCDRLGCKYLGYSCFVRVVFHEADGGRVRTVMIYAHHGWGGGSRTQGADLTKFSKHASNIDADIFLYSHVHRRQSDQIARLGAVGKHAVAKPKHIFICGTFLKTLSDTADATYAEIAGYPITSIGNINIKIKPTKSWVDVTSDV